MDPLLLLARWRDRASRVQTAHYESAAALGRWRLWIGIPLVMLSALMGTGLALGPEQAAWVGPLAAFMGALIAALAGVQTFLKHEERAEKHRSAGVRYGALKRRLEQQLAFPPANPDALERLCDELRREWDALNESSLPIPMAVWRRIERAAPAPAVAAPPAPAPTAMTVELR